MIGGNYDIPSNTMELTFSEPVQAAALPSGVFTIVASGGGTRTSTGTGTLASSSTQTFSTTGAASSGPTATVAGGSSVTGLISTATGLSVQPFAGLVIPRTS